MELGYASCIRTTAVQTCIPVSEITSPSPKKGAHLGWMQQFLQRWKKAPRSKADLVQALLAAQQHNIIDMDSRHMLEGVLWMADKTVAEVMVAAPKMDLIDIHATQDELLAFVIDKAHSRFPVYETKKENILGILLAKDLLKLQRAPELNIRALLRPAVFVPESKGLNDLLREFRHTRNHQALVVDEFGRVSGLVTIEDVLEEIVGEIEDEFDIQEKETDIFALADNVYRVNGDATLDRIKDEFDVHWPSMAEESFETIGGYISHAMGHVPRRGEHLQIDDLRFEVLHTKGGAVKWFRVTRSKSPQPAS
jgi:magnesium and cobalt transporter